MRLPIKSLLSLLFVTPVIVFSQTKVTTKDFRIISATATEWSAGAARQNSDGERGVQYEIKAVVKSKTGIVVDSLVTEKGTLPVEVVVALRRSLGKQMVKNPDTVQIIARLTYDKRVSSLSKETRTAISKFNKAKQFSFLLYQKKGKRCLAPVGEFSKKPASEPNQ